MRASYNWLRELSGVCAPPAEVADRLTRAGIEVEASAAWGEGLGVVVVAEVRAIRAHPKRDQLSLVTLFDGEVEVEVVCGASNVPKPPARVLFAKLGATLPGGLEIAERKIGGVLSTGMICSEVELGIGHESGGIFVVGPELDAAPGTPVVDALGLRDTIFEIGLTPNRPDCLGHIGLARELSVLFGRDFTAPKPAHPQAAASAKGAFSGASEVALAPLWSGEGPPPKKFPQGALAGGGVRVDIEDPQKCPRYGAALVLGVRVGPSPFWLRYRLHCLGLRAIHSVVDATNLVLMEQGHPIHAFDLARVRGRRIVVRRARSGETMKTLDGVERTFVDDDLLICDADGAVAIAGVMGGQDSEISERTENVLIECAYFEPRTIRRTARRAGLHTDSSHRFERGVDPNGVPAVLARATELIVSVAGGVACPTALDTHPAPITPVTIALRPARATALLGFATTNARVREILEGLGCDVAGKGESLQVSAPTARPDLKREVDLIEELARVQGYDLIPMKVPHVRPSAAGTSPMIRFLRDARVHAAGAGLHEAMSYSFVAPGELRAARVAVDAVPVVNPLSEDRSVMRTSLLPGLVAAARRSLRRQVDRVRLFEVGHTFHPSDGDLPREHTMLGVLLAGLRAEWIGDGLSHDFYDGKGVLEAIVQPLTGHAATLRFEESDAAAPWLHPKRRAAIELGGVVLGSLGELHPDVVDAVALGEPAVYVELSVDALFTAAEALGTPQAGPLPRYPFVARDIAMLVDEAHSAGAVAEALQAAAGRLAERVVLFDLYRGEQIASGQKSLAFRIVYRDPEGTLTDKRVDKIHAKLATVAKDRFGATVRS